MDHLKYFSLFVVFLSQNASPQLLNEESKKIVTKSKLNSGSGEHFECDLVLLPQQKQTMFYDVTEHISYDLYNWPKDKSGHVIVPYHISRGSHYSSEHVRIIRNAMDAIESETCIRFKPRKSATDFINIFSGRYCKSNLGRTGGAQELSLNWKKCLREGIVIHELLHALGFIHMHNRPNRDKYVKILWKNINPSFFKEFDRVNPHMFNYYGTSYDYQSIMHYSTIAFTKNGGQTIIPKDENFIGEIGHKTELSEGDIRRINTKYNCNVERKQRLEPFRHHTNALSYSGLRKPQIKDDDDDDLFNI